MAVTRTHDTVTASLPRVLGRYELLGEIAAGGMGVVYLGRARGAAGFERLVAVKCCHPHLGRDPRFAAMFLDEARLAARVHHPNVVATIDAADSPELYLVMDYVDGGTLAELTRASQELFGNFDADIALRIMSDVLGGLHAVHEARDGRGRTLGLVHRDVSPQNVLVGADGVARIVDFGIAKAEARSTVTADWQLKGKLGYMAPEQLRGESVTRWADIYAAGVVLWELLAGQRLFPAPDGDMARRLGTGDAVDPPSRVNPAISPALDRVVMRALALRPEARYPTAAAFADALDALPSRPVSAREVGSYLRDALAEPLERRHALVTRLIEATDAGPANTSTPGDVTASTALDLDLPRPSPRRRLARVLLWSTAGLVLTLAGALGWRAWHARAGSVGSPSATARPSSPPVPAARPAPVPATVRAPNAVDGAPSVPGAPSTVASETDASTPRAHRATRARRARRVRPAGPGRYEPPRI